MGNVVGGGITMTPEARLEAAGMRLPELGARGGLYVPGVAYGDLLFVSGQTSVPGAENGVCGRVGTDVTVEEAQVAAELCALRCLAEAKAVLHELAYVVRVIKVTGYVRSSADFGEQARVLDGASRVFIEAFGEAGRHARAAIGVGELPRGAAVEVEAVFGVQPQPEVGVKVA